MWALVKLEAWDIDYAVRKRRVYLPAALMACVWLLVFVFAVGPNAKVACLALILYLASSILFLWHYLPLSRRLYVSSPVKGDVVLACIFLLFPVLSHWLILRGGDDRRIRQALAASETGKRSLMWKPRYAWMALLLLIAFTTVAPFAQRGFFPTEAQQLADLNKIISVSASAISADSVPEEGGSARVFANLTIRNTSSKRADQILVRYFVSSASPNKITNLAPSPSLFSQVRCGEGVELRDIPPGESFRGHVQIGVVQGKPGSLYECKGIVVTKVVWAR